MSNAWFGYQNRVSTASIATSSAVPGLDGGQMQNDSGSAALAWQTTGTTEWALFDSGLPNATWQAFLLARTNLSTTATVRWRVGSAEGLRETPAVIGANFAAGLPAGWAYARNGTATYPVANGFLTTVAANQPRISTLGLLVEGPATNLFGNNDSGTTGQGTGNAIVAGGGTNGGGSVTTQCTYNGPDTNIFFIGQGGLTAGNFYTASWWVYIPGSAVLTALTMQWEGNNTNNTSVNANLALRDQFQRVSCTAKMTAATSSAVLRLSGAPANTLIYVCSKQIELGQSATSFIPTAGGATATRPADSLSSGAGVAAAGASGNYSLSVLGYWLNTPSLSGNLDVSLTNPTSTYSATARFGGTSVQAFSFNNAGVASGSLTQGYVTGGTSSRLVLAISPGTLSFASFGNPVQALTGLAMAVNPTAIALGAGTGASMWITNIGMYNLRLSDAQVAALATGGSTLTNVTTYDSGLVSNTVAAGYGQSLVTAPTVATGQICRLDITNANTDGYLNIPLAYAGPIFSPTQNISWDATFGRDDMTDELTSRGGQEYPSELWSRRRWDVSLVALRAAEVWPIIMEMDRIARAGGNMLFVFDPASADRAKETVFGRLKGGDLTYPYQVATRRGWKARITERL